jgi:signal peptidase I
MDPRTVSLLQDLARDGESRVQVKGDCMEPLFSDGATLTVRARRVYWPGDVVVFRTPAGDLAAHRVLGWRRAGLVTKGDHCVVHDAPVRRADIVGAADAPVSPGDRFRALVALAGIVVRRLAG